MAGLGTAELARMVHQLVGIAERRFGSSRSRLAAAASSPEFIGVFAADEIPTQSSEHSVCFIANTDPSTLPGTHWVAFVIFNNAVGAHSHTTYFFDSYGLPLSYYSRLHSECAQREYTNVRLVNTQQLQSIHSTVCGQYCALFLFFVHRFKSAVLAARALRDLANSVGRRDKVVISYINRLQPSQHVCSDASVWTLVGSRLTHNSENASGTSCCVTQCCCARAHGALNV